MAWRSAYTLSEDYLRDADASYDQERYLDALVGYDQYDTDKRDYIQYGGYTHVERIWENEYAWPRPDLVSYADERIEKIINQHLTLEDAEQFVQENIGKNNPYMGMIYLRLGELYEANGALRDAEDIYESVPDLFPQDQDLIDRALRNLEKLQQNSGS